MTRMFGIQSGVLRRLFVRLSPEPGSDERVEIYNLYHLLNHANLFCGGYIDRARPINDWPCCCWADQVFLAED